MTKSIYKEYPISAENVEVKREELIRSIRVCMRHYEEGLTDGDLMYNLLVEALYLITKDDKDTIK